jgi:hypothetical protein
MSGLTILNYCCTVKNLSQSFVYKVYRTILKKIFSTCHKIASLGVYY